jgi:hypothetical protein
VADAAGFEVDSTTTFPGTMAMAIEQLTLVYEYERLAPERAIQRISELLVRQGIDMPEFELKGRKRSTSQLLSKLKGATSFDVTAHGFNFCHGSLPRFQLDVLYIRPTEDIVVGWDDWVSGFIDDTNFVMAWVVDADYNHWQNAVDLEEYELAGKPIDDIPLRQNGMPYPLNRMEVDTSRNPGRWRFGRGYMEAVGAAMWLGSPFWRLTGADRASLKSLKWLSVSEKTQKAISIRAADGCFTTSKGDIGERQRQLRSILFPEKAPDGPNSSPIAIRD